MSTQPEMSFRFDEFELHPSRRILSRNGDKIPLAPKTFDVLTCLVANAGRVITKEELIKTVWQGAFVEESNLTQHIFALRKALGDRSSVIATLPGRGYQFTAPVQAIAQTVSEAQAVQPAPLTIVRSSRYTYGAAAAVIIVLCGLIGWGIRARLSGAVPGDHHEVVLADFENSTGDPAFNHTLDTLLAIDLNQSPYLAVASDDDTRQALKLMDQPTAALTPALAREVCQRINDQAVLTGTIANIGSKYLVTLSATDCQTGKALVQQKATANGREAVLKAVDTVAEGMRERLGESLKSRGHPGRPLQQAHTFSLDALRAYSQAIELTSVGKRREAIPFFQRALQLDPQFAAAWYDLARTYGRAGEGALAREAATKAYDLRDQGDDFLRLQIVSYYNLTVTGDLHARVANFVTWTQMYPNQPEPWRNLASLQGYFGHPELAIEPARRALALDPNNGYNYATLGAELHGAGHLEEAKAIWRQAIDRKIQNPDVLAGLYTIAYFQHDTATMNEMMALAHGTEQEGDFRNDPLFAEGRAKEAVAVWLRRAERMRVDGFPEHADLWLRVLLRREADYNLNQQLSRQLATIDQTKFPQNIIIANAELGRIAAAQAGLKLLDAQPVIDTADRDMNFPEARAAVALALHKPQEAIADLEIGRPYDNGAFEMVLMRGDAYRAARQPDLAITEYRKLVDHAYNTCTTPTLPLAHLGLARAFAMQGNHTAARSEYETLFTLWKDADADLPPLQRARLEYAQLK